LPGSSSASDQKISKNEKETNWHTITTNPWLKELEPTVDGHSPQRPPLCPYHEPTEQHRTETPAPPHPQVWLTMFHCQLKTPLTQVRSKRAYLLKSGLVSTSPSNNPLSPEVSPMAGIIKEKNSYGLQNYNAEI